MAELPDQELGLLAVMRPAAARDGQLGELRPPNVPADACRDHPDIIRADRTERMSVLRDAENWHWPAPSSDPKHGLSGRSRLSSAGQGEFSLNSLFDGDVPAFGEPDLKVRLGIADRRNQEAHLAWQKE